MTSLQLANELKSWAIEHRRWLHRHAELSMEENETTEFLQQKLEEIGVPYLRPTKTGIIGIIKGAYPGKTIGLRADIDAVPLTEETRVEYHSLTEGVMHASGHDFHAACLLTAAKILVEQKDKMRGTVKLIFQPGEEGVESGAKAIMEKGDLDDCEAFVAIHASSSIPVGEVSVEPGPRMAASSGIYIDIFGQGGHGGSPWETVDPITACAAVIMNLQPMLTREIDRRHMVVVSFGNLHAGNMKTFIPDKVKLSGTLRFFEPKLEEQIRRSVTRIVTHTCKAYRAEADVHVTNSFPPVVNDPALTGLAQKTAAAIWGEDNLVHIPASTYNDDFAFFNEKAPVLFVIVGTSNPEKECDYPPYHPCFDVDEDAIPNASAFLSQFALDYLNS